MNKTITLDIPITRGEQTISTITLSKPNANALRGISLIDLLQMNIDALSRVLPRISEPTLTTSDINKMDSADLVQLGIGVSSFLLPKTMPEDYVST